MPPRARLEWLVRQSLEAVRAGQAPGGAYLAAPGFGPYRFSWLRDGAFIADAMSRAGEIASAEAFFGWCGRVLAARADRIDELVAQRRAGRSIDPRELLPARYTADGREALAEWNEHQPDGYGAWLWALGEHAARHGVSWAPYRRGVALSVRYLNAFWDDPCYDWWEERLGLHPASLAAVAAGLRAAAGSSVLPRALADEAEESTAAIRATVVDRGLHLGRLTRSLGDPQLDASLVACATPFRLLAPEDPIVAATIAALESSLAHRGVHRYAGDAYYGGGEWLVLAALLGWHYAEVGRAEDAWTQLGWVAGEATATGELPEQSLHHLFTPAARATWEARWGRVARPLLWSHAAFITLALTLGVRPGDPATGDGGKSPPGRPADPVEWRLKLRREDDSEPPIGAGEEGETG